MATLPTSRTPPGATRAALSISAAAGVAAGLVVLWLVGSAVVAAAFLGSALVLAGVLVAARRLFPGEAGAVAEPDWSVARAIAASSPDAIAVTDRAGRLVCANDRYEAVFGGFPTPPGLPVSGAGVDRLGAAGRAAWRDGDARVEPLLANGTALAAEIARTGADDDLLVWRFRAAEGIDLAHTMERLIAGATGDRLGSAGIMAALINPDGRIRIANRVLRARAMGHEEGAIIGRDFARFLITDANGMARFEREGLTRNPLRVLQIPFLDGDDAPMLVALIDEEEGAAPAIGESASAHIRSLVALMPFGVALIGGDGRFLQMNDAFARAAAVDPASPPIYPGDLVVREDKGVVADAIRRFAGGAAHSTDLAVRLKDHPDEPVALSIAGARGLGDSAVLLSLKDNSEETRLKREVAQAIKMQAVGQLAGGVAHDFNNILTAIVGHCDLMLMRHSPGDSDYDDIQQIRANSNRAASLTRQLLAFSRQQTLRPQILQLPDVISEVTNLLTRVIGETVTLTVKHGRALSPVRADPGQLEQVVVNLAVNARDAMMATSKRGTGTLAIQTYAMTAAQVRALGSDILPPADYTVLEVSDTGGGIAPDILPKIFEPFFTTKEVGKGTGLGLSTVYGIVKQSGGWIFAENRRTGVKGEQGAVFVIYLPVHSAGALPDPAPLAVRAPPRAKQADLWGSGTILLVEDEDMVRVVAERALTRQGYQVLTAEHGEAALELLAASARPDLLISDVMMPLMDGPTLVRHARARYPDLPILFMSGYAEETIRRTIDLDNVAFLAKPFTVQQLAEAARDVLAAK